MGILNKQIGRYATRRMAVPFTVGIVATSILTLGGSTALAATPTPAATSAQGCTTADQLQPGAHCENSSLPDIDASGFLMSNIYLSNSDLTRAKMMYANLTDADLSTVNLSDASMIGADMTGANLDGAILDGADLTYAKWTDGHRCQWGSISRCN